MPGSLCGDDVGERSVDEVIAGGDEGAAREGLQRAEGESRAAFDRAIERLFACGASPAFIAETLRPMLHGLTLTAPQWQIVAEGGAKLGNNAVRDIATARFKSSASPPPKPAPPPLSRRPVPSPPGPARRFPLLVGLRAFRLLAIVPAWAVLGLAIAQTLHVAGPDLPFGLPLRMIGFLGLVLAFGAVVLPWVLLPIVGFGGARTRRALSTRACDVLVDGSGIRVVGGPAHGFAASFAWLAPPSGTQLRADGLWLRGGEGSKWTGKWLHVPFPPDPDERASIEALGATIAAHAAAAELPHRSRSRLPPGTILCPTCGAPQMPAEAAEITCPHCAARIAVPAEIVSKVLAMRKVAAERASDDRLASAVLAQRGAGVANAVAFGGGFVMWALAGITALVSAVMMFLDGREAGLPRLYGLGLVEASLCLFLLGAVTSILAGRRALRLLTLGFGAIAPERPGDPPTCRRCGGPLPDPGNASAVARCVYCAAANVMAADLRVEAAIVARFGAFAADPHDVLASCAKMRRRAHMLVAAGVALGLWGVVSLGVTASRPAPGPRTALIPFARPTSTPSDSSERAAPASHPKSAATLEPAEGALRVERVARLDRRTVARLVPGAQGGVDVVAQGESRFERQALRTDPGLDLSKNVGGAPLRWERLGGEADRAWPPVFARLEGGALAFARDGWVWTRDAGGAARARHAPGFFEDPVVVDLARGPGGSVLTTTRASSEGHLRVRRIDPDGTTKHLVEDAREPALSPSGDRLAFARLVGERFQIALAPVDRPSELELLTRGEGHAALPTWSPDGRRLAFVTRPVRDPVQFNQFEGAADLWVLDLEGHAVRLTRGASLEMAPPVWTSEGLWVLTYETGEASGTVIWRVVPR